MTCRSFGVDLVQSDARQLGFDKHVLPAVRNRVIERDWYELGAWQLTDTGACKNCGTQIPGLFAGQPGAWGARRLGVGLAAHAAPADDFAANGVAAACVG